MAGRKEMGGPARGFDRRLSLKLGRSRDWFQIEGQIQVDDDLCSTCRTC